MSYSTDFSNKRTEQRVNVGYPVQISIGTQFTLQGQLKDLSLKSAFIKIKSSTYVQPNDEIGFAIQCPSGNAEVLIDGLARISRIVVGEGFAIYFTKMNNASETHLKQLLSKIGLNSA